MKPVKWNSNSKNVLSQIPEEERASEVKILGEDLSIDNSKILGLIYNPEEDVFTYKGDPSPGGKTNKKLKRKDTGEHTRRNLLSVIMKIFDPLGFISPFTIRGKLIMQRVMITKLDWEDTIPEKCLDMWLKWLQEMPLVSQIKVPRHLGILIGADIQIHLFCDASIEALCCVFYIRVKSIYIDSPAFRLSMPTMVQSMHRNAVRSKESSYMRIPLYVLRDSVNQ